MPDAALKPWSSSICLNEASNLRTHVYGDEFSIVRVETSGPVADVIHKSSVVPSLLVSTFLQPVSEGQFQLWLDGKRATTGGIAAYRTNVIDLAAEPETWADRGLDYVHFHVRRSSIEATATDLGYDPIGSFRSALAVDDMVLAQITKAVLPSLAPGRAPNPLALEQIELILSAHLLQRHGAARLRKVVSGGLAGWQQRRALELLYENLDGSVGLTELARECELSVSHFSRAFKATFGTTPHQWLTDQRLERAKDLLARTRTALADVAIQSGFADQAAFGKTFRREVGVTPGTWRRERARRG